MLEIESILSHSGPYHLAQKGKQIMLLDELNALTQFHAENSEAYGNILNKTNLKFQAQTLEEVPYLPVQLFKMVDLFSLPDSERFKTLNSSGTTGQQVSRIHIDRYTASLQTKALNVIVRSFLGKNRLPMIIVDFDFLKNRHQFSARSAGTIGFSQFGHHHLYLLDEYMNIRWDELERFLEEFKNQPIFLFGFTFIVWQNFLEELRKQNTSLDLSGSILIHGGGWKKLHEHTVTDQVFKNVLKERLRIDQVYNYYGMVEQVGSIYMQCECGYLHTPDFADVLIRHPHHLKPLPYGESGLIQVLSMLPRSYPGHSLLTEDIGVILGEDDCPCGRKGKYFSVAGRLPKAEIRGCSDTMTST
ncbi:LuxE/PaaK family acyltransferase [Paenibacillus pabuli]|uniref:LuxE/PaaK family acyltransferase n=1 Tax=Paenibacillus pabuli TaxID=1472 RepID=UPI00078400D8|nr:acyl-protein synthetase [Paenibacillus pabuli]MEC0129065.1 acyl-protein synthetase [Paenibacillus pabuli]